VKSCLWIAPALIGPLALGACDQHPRQPAPRPDRYTMIPTTIYQLGTPRAAVAVLDTTSGAITICLPSETGMDCKLGTPAFP